ncbi:hypothetical protein FHS29_007139, partial [Saccharothrix tamanrassetensis]|nr:hypothetical protein [Saccharothrix tamanrassetensis]
MAERPNMGVRRGRAGASNRPEVVVDEEIGMVLIVTPLADVPRPLPP